MTSRSVTFTVGSTPTSAALLLAGGLLLSACGVEYPTRLAEGTHEVPTGRPGDDLLQRPELQKLVQLRIRKESDSLEAALSSSQTQVRARAAYELASVIDPGSVPPLLRALGDEAREVRRDAAFALGQFDDDRLVGALQAPGPSREAALLVPAALDGAGEMAGIRDVMATGPADSVVAAIGGRIADALGVRLLEQLETETRREVREELLRSASRVGAERTLEHLLTVVPDGTPDRRATALAISYLVRRGTESSEGLRRLSQYLEDEDARVRINAAYGFRWAQDPRLWRSFLPAIRRTMDGWSSREPAAMQMVAGIERSQLLDDHAHIIRFLEEAPDWRTRTNAALALEGWENQDLPRPALLNALSDPSEHVAIAAARSLSNSPPPPVYREQLQRWVESHPDRTLVAAHLAEGIASNGGGPFVAQWLARFPTTEVAEWVLGLESLGILNTGAVLGALRQGAIADSRALGLNATEGLVRRWPTYRSQATTRDWFRETALEIWETGDPERRALVREILEDTVFADSSEVVGEFELEEPMRIDDPLRIDWDELRELGRHPRLVLETDEGRVVLVLDTEEAPLTVQWMTRFARRGFFDGVPFHRVVPNFVVQAGDTRLAEGGRSLNFNMQTEATQIRYTRGTLGMARTAERDTEGSQFFVTHSMAPHLYAAYTAWGWVSEGMHVVDRIQPYDRVRSAVVLPDQG